jgi:hypothetical protein
MVDLFSLRQWCCMQRVSWTDICLFPGPRAGGGPGRTREPRLVRGPRPARSLGRQGRPGQSCGAGAPPPTLSATFPGGVGLCSVEDGDGVEDDGDGKMVMPGMMVCAVGRSVDSLRREFEESLLLRWLGLKAAAAAVLTTICQLMMLGLLE